MKRRKIKRTENILNDSFHFPSIGAANNTETGDKAGSTKDENEAKMDESDGFERTGAKDIPVVHKAAVARTPHKKLRLSANSSVIRSDWLYNEWKDITQGLLKPSLNADLNSFLGRIPKSDLETFDLKTLVPSSMDQRRGLYHYLDELINALGSTQVQLKTDLRIVSEKLKQCIE